MSVVLRERILFTGFEIKLDLLVEVRPYDTYMDFWLKQYAEEITYHPVEGFPMVDKMAADRVIILAMKKLLDNNLFGSGWPLYPNSIMPTVVID